MGRKSKADERKPEILRHAYEVVKRDGLEKASLARIAEHMGVATSLLTHYFNSREELVSSLAEYMVEVYDESLMLDFARIEEPRERLDAILEARFTEYARQVVDDRVWYDVYNRGMRNEAVKACFTDLYKRDLEVLQKEIVKLLPDGPDRTTAAEKFSAAMVMMMEGISYYNAVMGSNADVDGAVRMMKEMFRLYFWNTASKPEG